eukprot:UN11466
MKNPNLISVPELVDITENTFLTTGTIDNPIHLKDSKVYLYSGTNDTEVVSGVVKKAKSYYEHFIPNNYNIKFVNNIPSVHDR